MTTLLMPTKISEIVKLTPEELETFNLAELSQLHANVSQGATKPARLKADIIAAMIQARSPEAKKAAKAALMKENAEKGKTKERTGQAVNSVKTTPKGKVKQEVEQQSLDLDAEPVQADPEPTPEPKKKVIRKPKVKTDTATPKADQEPKAEPKQKEPKAKALEEMSPAELLAYIKTLESKVENGTFPSVIEGEKINYKKITVKNLQELQKKLMEKPYQIFCFMDERIDGNLTQFMTVYASKNVITLIDKNRTIDSHIEMKPDAIEKGEHYEKREKGLTATFPIAFYEKSSKNAK